MQTHVLILAGGRSSRMGQDKASLLLENQQTLLNYMLELVMAVGVESVFISRPCKQLDACTGQQLETDAKLGSANIQLVYDEESFLGPLAGIQACLKQLQLTQLDGQLLVLPIDMPALAVADLQQLVAISQQSQRSCYFAEHFLPVVFADLNLLQQQINQLMTNKPKQRSFKNLLSQLAARPIDLSNSQKSRLINLNTPEQWQTYLNNRS